MREDINDNLPMSYTTSDKMCLLMRDNLRALQVVNRFGLPLGVGEKTIEQICTGNGIDSNTFVQVVNFILNLNYSSGIYEDNQQGIKIDIASIDLPTIRRYIENGHTYFLDFELPRIREVLVQAMSGAFGVAAQIPMLIIKFYDEYVEQIRTHIEHENQNAFELHTEDDKNMYAKLSDLKSLLIKYYSAPANSQLFTAIHDIYEVEEEIFYHCAVEEKMLIPALKKSGKHKAEHIAQKKEKDNALSERETEVLKQIVKGLSNKEIADVLCISAHTVISHRKNITRKLNIHSTAALTIYAIFNGIIDI